MKYLISILFLFFSTSLLAETWIDANISSVHSEKGYCYRNECKTFNQNNWGLGFTQSTHISSLDVKGGFYKNSYYKTSIYLGLNIKHLFDFQQFSISPGIMVGAVSGYQDTEMADYTNMVGLLPIFLPNVAVGTDTTRASIGYLPGSFAGGVNVFTFQIQFSLPKSH